MSHTENRHVIAASNFFLGTANFLILQLPPNWDLRMGSRPPEVDRTFREGDVAWVTEGSASHVLVDESRKLGILLEVKVGRGELPPRGGTWVRVRSEGTIPVQGHLARYRLGEVRKGLRREKRMTRVDVELYCSRGDRTLSLSLTGSPPPPILEEFLSVLPLLECHCR